MAGQFKPVLFLPKQLQSKCPGTSVGSAPLACAVWTLGNPHAPQWARALRSLSTANTACAKPVGQIHAEISIQFLFMGFITHRASADRREEYELVLSNLLNLEVFLFVCGIHKGYLEY